MDNNINRLNQKRKTSKIKEKIKMNTNTLVQDSNMFTITETKSLNYDKDLNSMLKAMSNEELNFIVEIITKQFNSDLDHSELYKKYYPNHKMYIELIANELRVYGGNTVVNWCRKFEGPSYFAIVKDVAKRLRIRFSKNDDLSDIENAIVNHILVKMKNKKVQTKILEYCKQNKISYRSLGLKELSAATILKLWKTGGFKSYQLLMIVANATSRQLTGKGLLLATNASLNKWAHYVMGPIGWGITATWTIKDILDPAYRVTVPAVIYLSMVKALKTHICPSCNKSTDFDAPYCKWCKTELTK